MKLTVSLLVLLAVLALGSLACAAVVPVNDTLYAGWNYISLQGVPTNPDPVTIFPAGLRLDCNLWRWDGATQSQYVYDEFVPSLFGNMLLGEGYWVYSETSTPYSYNALNDTDQMDIWISLPAAGWHYIGNPFGYEFPWENAKVTDGNVTVSLQVAAKTNGWLESTTFWWNAAEQSQYDMALPDDWPSGGTTMLPKHGYQVATCVNKIALILEAQPQP